MTTLAGTTIVLTRTPEDSAIWEKSLLAAGASVIGLPCIRTELNDAEPVRAALAAELEQCDWLILTSRRGVDALTALGCAALVAAGTRIAVVGAATAQSAENALGRADLVGTGGTAAKLAREIAANPAFEPGQRVLAVLAANAGPVVEETLTAAGARCRRIDAYRTIPHEPVAPKRPLGALGADAVVFSSPTTVDGFLNQVEPDTDCALISIGPSTSARLREAGLTVAGEAAVPGIDGIIEIIGATLHGSNHH